MWDQCRRRWADDVQMLYKCFVFAGDVRDVGFDPGNIHPMLVQCEPIVSDTGPTLGARLVFAGLYHITAVKKCYVCSSFVGGTVSKADQALNQ